jgi:TPP-dependent 2-oxoacid decarboxylase
MMGKAVVDESNPQFIGLYEGANSRPYRIRSAATHDAFDGVRRRECDDEWVDRYVRQRVESADCVLQLGVLMTDLNTGTSTAASSVLLPMKSTT